MTDLTSLKTLPAVDLEFPLGLPGLEGARSFRLEPLGGDMNVFGQLSSRGPVTLLGQSAPQQISIIVAAPGLLWPDYAVEVNDDALDVLGLDAEADAITLVIVNLSDDPSGPTANLFAPIVVNVPRRLALQIVPQQMEAEWPWSVRAPIPITLVS